MSKTEVINTRVEPSVKRAVAALLSPLGLTTTDAINMFLHQVMLHKGLPFEVRRPNAVTRRSIHNAQKGRNLKRTSLEALKREFGKDA
jgi:DNA-damage-inducible protein J